MDGFAQDLQETSDRRYSLTLIVGTMSPGMSGLDVARRAILFKTCNNVGETSKGPLKVELSNKFTKVLDLRIREGPVESRPRLDHEIRRLSIVVLQ